jgi:SAM-dependent methyltransferase
MVYSDGSAGDFDYGNIGTRTYSSFRKADPRIAALITEALGFGETLLNVGAGAGSFEPNDRSVTAVEPSASIRAQRPNHLPEAIDAVSEDLPFPDKSFDASLTTFSVHQWTDLTAGLREMLRVTRDRIVILTCDPARLNAFWLTEYAPEVIAAEARRYPEVDRIVDTLGMHCKVISLPIPNDCVDGFNEAYFGRPELLLNSNARQACSAWGFVSNEAIERFERDLSNDLQSGVWDARWGHLRTQPELEGSLRLIIGHLS